MAALPDFGRQRRAHGYDVPPDRVPWERGPGSGIAHGGDIGRGGDGFLPASLRSVASDTLYSGAPSTWLVSRNIKRKSDESGQALTSPPKA